MKYDNLNEKSKKKNNNILVERKEQNLIEFKKNRKQKPKIIEKIVNTSNEKILLEQIEILKKQLENVGIKPIEEVISYEEGKEKLYNAIQKCFINDSYENNKEVEKWDNFINNHPQYLIEIEESNKKWENDNIPLNLKAKDEQLKYIPKNIFEKCSIESLMNNGVNKNLATRIMRNRALWLVRMPQEEISSIHIADLKFKYNYSGLDIIETRALYSCLPSNFDNDITGEKNIWKEELLNYLKDMISKNEKNQLSQKLIRNNAYTNSQNINKELPKMYNKPCKLLKNNLLEELLLKKK